MTLHFQLLDGSTTDVEITSVWNAGYTGRSRATVMAHVRELAELGVAPPTRIPAIYPLSPYLARQDSQVHVLNERTSGEVEWAMVVAGDRPADVFITVASDHSDRALEVHGVLWGKNAAVDVIGTRAWRLVDVQNWWDELRVRSWVSTNNGSEELIQDGCAGDLLPPAYWLEQQEISLEPGAILLSGTIPMLKGVDQFGDRWRAELFDPVTDQSLELAYDIVVLPTEFG